MGTRASFFVGDPSDLTARVWLGCIAWDGYPSNFTDLASIATEADFRLAVRRIASMREDFADPSEGGFPFPWQDDLYLTDCTYAWFDGAVQFCRFHYPFVSLSEYIETDGEDYDTSADDPRHVKVLAPAAYDTTQPDSIMVLRFSR